MHAELFLNNNKAYYALYKVDSLIIDSSGKTQLLDLITAGLNSVLKKTENKSISQVHIGKTAFSQADIQNHINDFTSFPIFNEAVLNKGVYINFKEFKLNIPSIKDFKIQKGSLSEELIVTNQGQTYPLQDCWGYCDGTNLYIKSAKNFFKLYRLNNSFDTYAFKSLKKVTSVQVGKVLLLGLAAGAMDRNQKKVKYVPVHTPLQLDMYSGELY